VGKKLLLVLGALLAGAAGLGLEVVITNLVGLAIGYGLAAAVGITFFISGWALGAWFSGSREGSETWLWLAAGGALALVGLFGPQILVNAVDSGAGPSALWALTILVLISAAFPQGVLLPMLARHWPLGKRGDLGWLFGASLAGAACGAILIGDFLPALYGRATAAALAGCLALMVAVCGAILTRREPEPEVLESGTDHPADLGFLQAGLVLAMATGWIGTLEWMGVRLGLLWFGGMQETLANVLVSSMVALALGAAILPRVLPRSRSGLAFLALLCSLSTASLFFVPRLQAGLEQESLILRTFLLIGVALFPFGAWVPMLHRSLGGESAKRLGQLLGWEAIGVCVGLPLSHALLLPFLGMQGVLLSWSALGCGLFLLFTARRQLKFGLVVVASLGLLAYPLADSSPALQSPPLNNPQLEILEFAEGEHFAISVVQDGILGERTLMTDGFRAAASGRDYAYMRALGHLPLLMHPGPRAVGVLAFGTGTTAGSVSLHAEVEAIEVLELSALVTDHAQQFEAVNRGVLSDPRVMLTIGDGRHTLGRRAGAYDVLTMEPLLPDSPFGVYLYTEGFYARAKGALKSGGLLCQWVPPHALEPIVFDAVLAAFTSAFEWSSVWVFGTQVILLGSDHEPLPDAGRFPSDEGELQSELAFLGLDSLEGLLARYVVPGARIPLAERPLTDLDPWVIYRPRRSGREALFDLPRNLAQLREWARPLPDEWWLGLDPKAEARFSGLALVREAREAFAVERARAMGANAQYEGLAAGSAGLLLRATKLLGNEPGLLRIEAEIDFNEALMAAKILLASDPSENGSARAAAHLARAAALRPERADVHAYLSVALERLGSDRAPQEMDRAHELCPRLLETRVGEQLAVWGVEF
jgi:spermidine synthase